MQGVDNEISRPDATPTALRLQGSSSEEGRTDARHAGAGASTASAARHLTLSPRTERRDRRMATPSLTRLDSSMLLNTPGHGDEGSSAQSSRSDDQCQGQKEQLTLKVPRYVYWGPVLSEFCDDVTLLPDACQNEQLTLFKNTLSQDKMNDIGRRNHEYVREFQSFSGSLDDIVFQMMTAGILDQKAFTKAFELCMTFVFNPDETTVFGSNLKESMRRATPGRSRQQVQAMQNRWKDDCLDTGPSFAAVCLVHFCLSKSKDKVPVEQVVEFYKDDEQRRTMLELWYQTKYVIYLFNKMDAWVGLEPDTMQYIEDLATHFDPRQSRPEPESSECEIELPAAQPYDMLLCESPSRSRSRSRSRSPNQ